jgi:hypothetical protein
MALARVTSNFVSQSTVSTTISIAWTPASLGNMLIVSFIDTVLSLSAPTIADTNLNTWVVTCPVIFNSNTGVNCAMWYATSCKAGATTITVTTGSCSFRYINVSEWSGQDQSAAFDQHSEAVSIVNSTVVNSGSKTTTFPNEVIYGFAQGGGSLTKGATFTAEPDDGGGNLPEWKIVAATGSYSTDWTQAVTNKWVALMATFKEAVPISDDYWTNQLSSQQDTIVTVWG